MQCHWKNLEIETSSNGAKNFDGSARVSTTSDRVDWKWNVETDI